MQYHVKCNYDQPNIGRAQLCTPEGYPRIVDTSGSFTADVKPGACPEIARNTKKKVSDICIDRFYHVDSIPPVLFEEFGCAISEVSS
jgi:hypothetical protein